MKLNRRGFLSLSALAGLSYAESSWSLTTKRRSHRYPAIQTFTDETSANFTLILPKDLNESIEVMDEYGRSLYPLKVQGRSRQDSEYKVLKVAVSGLNLENDFYLRIVDQKSGYYEDRLFRALDTSSANSKFALVSCMNDKTHRAKMWQSLEDKNVDAIFFLGDAVYADYTLNHRYRRADQKQLWDRFIQAWHKLDLYHWPVMKPVFAIWDDHDYGDNNSDRTYDFTEEATENFKWFYGEIESVGNVSRGPGISFELNLFNQQFLFLDCRSFRSEKEALNETLLGINQERWLFDKLANGQGPAWLMLGSQWFGAYLKKEGFEYTHPNAFSSILERLRNSDRHISFVSGDVHFSEVMRVEPEILGYETWELTSSSMHSVTVPGWHRLFKNPRRIASTGRYNYLVVQTRQKEDIFQHVVSSYGSSRRYFKVSRGIRV